MLLVVLLDEIPQHDTAGLLRREMKVHGEGHGLSRGRLWSAPGKRRCTAGQEQDEDEGKRCSAYIHGSFSLPHSNVLSHGPCKKATTSAQKSTIPT